MSKYGYVRVSTVEQNIGRQLQTMKEQGIDIGNLDPVTADKKIFNGIRSGNTFIDKLSGKNMDRPQLQALLNTVEKGDEIVFSELSRMGRSTQQVLELTNKLVQEGVKLTFLKENLVIDSLDNAMTNFILAVFSAFAQLELGIRKERQREGIAIARQNNKYKGRKPSFYDEYTLNFIMDSYINKKLSVKQASSMIKYQNAAGEEKTGISAPTFYRLLDKWLSEHNMERSKFTQVNDSNGTSDDNKTTEYDEDMFIDMDITNIEPLV